MGRLTAQPRVHLIRRMFSAGAKAQRGIAVYRIPISLLICRIQRDSIAGLHSASPPGDAEIAGQEVIFYGRS